jgi:transposase-like protein
MAIRNWIAAMTINITDPVFHDETKAREFLELQRWPHGPVCPYCKEHKNVVRLGGEAGAKGQVLCRPCRKKFTVTVGTVMERSHIPLTKWLMGFRLMAASKKGISAHQMHRMMGITYKTAWFLNMRIREAMGLGPDPAKTAGPLGGKGKVVESDETFVGGKAKNAKNGKPVPKKYPVIALVERDGEIRAKHVADVTAKTLRTVLRTQVSRKSHLMTDDSLVYYWVGKEFDKHESVNHSKDEYVRGKAHVNTAEAFFALLKRGIMGSFHSVSEQHLQRYADEFAFRWNHRLVDDATRANEIIKASAGKRLTYRRIDQA